MAGAALNARTIGRLSFASGPEAYSKLALNLGPNRLTAALPVQRRRGGLLLALPAEALSDQELEDLQAGVPVGAFGAYGLATVAGDPAAGGDGADGETVVEVLFVDYSASGYPLLTRLGASEPDVLFLSFEGDACWPRQADLWEAAAQFLADGGTWAGPPLGGPALPVLGAGGPPPPTGGGDTPRDDEFGSVTGGDADAGGAAAPPAARIDHVLVATLQAALAPLEARLVALETTGLQAGGAAPTPSVVPVPPRAAPTAARVRAAAGYDVGQEAARLGLTPEQVQRLVRLAGPPPSRLGDPLAPGFPTGSPLGAGVPVAAAVADGDSAMPPPGLRHSAPVFPTLPTLPGSLADGSVSDPAFLKQLLLQNMALTANLVKGRPTSTDPYAILAEGGSDQWGTGSSARGCAAQQAVLDAHAKNPEATLAAGRRLLAKALKVPVTGLKPESMTEHFERNVPLGHTKCLTYFSFILANLWRRAEEGDMPGLQADLLLGLTFAEQVAVQGGSEYMLAWLLTGLEDPPWATLEQHRPSNRGLATAHARLADPRFITANLAYIRDMDTMFERTQTTHLRSGPASSSTAAAAPPLLAVGAPPRLPVPPKPPKAKAKGAGKGATPTPEEAPP